MAQITAPEQLPATLLQELVNGWRIWDDRQPGNAHDAITRDSQLGRMIANGDEPPTFRLWENVQALVVSRRDAALPNFTSASVQLAAEGWPVVQRETGGSALPHGPGILQLSLVMPRSSLSGSSTDAVFQMLCHPLLVALTTVGISSGYGRVPAAFCDGRYNLVVQGKKIAGTAQIWRANVARHGDVGEGYVLAHASLFVAMDKYAVTRAVNRFYALAGGEMSFDENAVTTASDCHGLSAATGVELMAVIRSRIIHALQDNLSLATSAS